MNRDQVEALVRMIKEVCPQQQVNGFTVDTWHAMALSDVDYADGVAALRKLAGQQRFIALADLVGAVKAIRSARIEHDVDNAITPITEGSAGGFLAELRRRTGAAAELRQVPPVRLVKEISPPKYVGKPGQAGFEVTDRRPEMDDIRARLQSVARAAQGPEPDRELTRARALLALVEDRETWEQRAREALGSAAKDRDVAIKAAALVRDHDRARQEAS